MTTPAPQPWAGGVLGARGVCVLAPNAGPMTLDGTNTWVIREPGATRCLVVDPGPLHRGHLAEVAAVAQAEGEVAAVLLTHGHSDHSEGARAFAELVGCGVRAFDPAQVYGDEGLHDGDVVEVDGLELRVLGTPGHTSDSLSFLLPAERAVLTGDTVLGRGTAVVAHPDGVLGAYLGSLRRLRDLAERHDVEALWPGHGPALTRPGPVLDHYLAHRAERLAQVRDAIAGGAGTASDVVRTVYADVSEALWPAAEMSVRAQMAYLQGKEGLTGST